MKCRKIVFVIFIAIVLSASKSVFLWAGEPGKLIMDTIERSLTIRKELSPEGEVKTKECEQRLWVEISPIFDFESGIEDFSSSSKTRL